MPKTMKYSDFLTDNLVNYIADDQVLDFTPFKEHGLDYSVRLESIHNHSLQFCVVLPPSRHLINFTPSKAHDAHNHESFTFDLPFPWSVWYFLFAPNTWSKTNKENVYFSNFVAHRTKPHITLSNHPAGWWFPSINGTCTGHQTFPPAENLFEFVNTTVADFFFHNFNLDSPIASPMMVEFLRRVYDKPGATLDQLYTYFSQEYNIHQAYHLREPFLKMFSYWEKQSVRSITRDKSLFPTPGTFQAWNLATPQVKPAMISH